MSADISGPKSMEPLLYQLDGAPLFVYLETLSSPANSSWPECGCFLWQKNGCFWYKWLGNVPSMEDVCDSDGDDASSDHGRGVQLLPVAKDWLFWYKWLGNVPFMEDVCGKDNDSDDACQQTVQRVGFFLVPGTCLQLTVSISL